MQRLLPCLALFCAALPASLRAQSEPNVIDEVVWVVGDDPILLSDVEDYIMQAKASNAPIENAYCTVPEQIAVQKLYLHQADLDSIDITETEVMAAVSERISDFIRTYGSRENLEAVAHRSVAQIREMLVRSERDQMRIQEEQRKLTENIKVTPAEVRDYFKDFPADSLPQIPTCVEVQIITSQPQPTREEVERVENQLHEYARRVNAGEIQFSTLARFNSEDEVSASRGGELDYMARKELVPEFSNVAFSLNDPKKVSKIVKTEFGYHIMQLVDKRGDKVKVRHILLRPQIPDSTFQKANARLDSIADDIRAGKFSFDMAALQLSEDKDTRLNNGLLFYSPHPRIPPTSRFEMKQLNQDIAKVVDTLKVGQISRAFVMTNEKGQQICAIVRLKNRIDAHPANTTDDFQTLRDVVYQRRCEEKLERWVREKVKSTYVRIKPEWRSCSFRYEGWIK
ncbi:MAG: peptidylprolyl isomerase [Alloprevotella sp.]|nr:peptidylprolyl isomerase [Alloprevotella sp.]